MPLTTKKIRGKIRIVEKNTGRIAKRKEKAIDGGGHSSESAAKRQIRAIGISKARKKGHRIPKKR